MTQPRERSTGRWGARDHSAPEFAVQRTPLDAWDAEESAKILQCLANLTQIFDYLDVLADVGEERFFAPDGIVLGSAIGRLIQLGEQAGGMPRDFRDLQAKTPDFTAMVGMRNKLAHEYEELNSALIWSTVLRCQSHHAQNHAAVRRHYDVTFDAQQRWMATHDAPH